MKYFKTTVTCFLFVLFSLQQALALDVVRYAKKRNPAFDAAEYEVKSYYLSLLKMALEITTTEFDPYKLEPSTVGLNGGRAAQSLLHNKHIDIKWLGSSYLRKTELLPIKIGLLHGKSGYQLLMVREEDVDKFSKISSASELKNFTAGIYNKSHKRNVFKRNNYRVTTFNLHSKLYLMLKNKRFDFFPVEVYGAYLHQNSGIVSVPNIALYHTKEIYYFVNKRNTRLYQRVKLGLEKLTENGAFKKHFETHSMMKPYQTFNPDDYEKVFMLN